MKYYLLLLFSLTIQLGFSQTISQQFHKIDSLQKHKMALKKELETLTQQLETEKLMRIQLALKKYAIPISANDNQVVHHLAMSLGYNDLHEQPNWVAHIISSDIAEGNIGRTNDFRPDSMLTNGSATLEDYWESGYDRGHLAPSADFRWSQKALSESYLYSNMSPQLPEFNREIWADVENLVRKWAVENQEVYVITGPILKKGLPTIGEKNKISIPEYFYKIVLDYREPEVKGIAFLVPHRGMKLNPTEFLVSIDSVEKMTGIDFFPALPDDLEAPIEAQKELAKWNKPVEIAPPPPISLAKGQIAASNAKNYVGHKATICGTVVSTKFSEKSQTTYINLDYTFPNQVFTLVIFGKDRPNFPYNPEIYLKNQQLCVRGDVEDRNGTAQIAVSNAKKIHLIPREDEEK